eukprot:c25868_g1_i1 orf=16-663(-)
MPVDSRKGKSPAVAGDAIIYSTADAGVDHNHQVCNSGSKIAASTLSVVSGTNHMYRIGTSAGGNALEATLSSAPEMSQRALRGSLLFCPSDPPPVHILSNDVSTSAAAPVTSQQVNTRSANAKLARSRKSITSEVKKTRRTTLPTSSQGRRSTLFFSNSSSGRSSHSSTSSTQSQKRTRLSLPTSVGAGSSGSNSLPQVEKVAHSKTWKRNLFHF